VNQYQINQTPNLSRDQKTGLKGQLWAVNQLKQRGYQVDCTDTNIIINQQLNCIIKTSTLNFYTKEVKGKSYNYQRWCWSTVGINTDNDLLILLAYHGGRYYPFIMPSAWATGRSSFQISTHPTNHKGILAPALDNWAWVDYLLKNHYQNGSELRLSPMGAML